jgi:hypothetical protein
VALGPASAAASGKLGGTLTVIAVTERAGRRLIRTRFRGTVQGSLAGGAESDPVDVTVEVVLGVSESRIDAQLVLDDEDSKRLTEPIALRLEWQGTPIVATISTTSLRNAPAPSIEDLAARKLPIAIDAKRLQAALQERITLVTAREDGEVLRAGNVLHDRAVSAIERIGVLLGDPRFAPAALEKLFPAPADTGSLRIAPTLDWVLFHRRRDRDCGAAVVAPRPVPEPEPQTHCHLVYRITDDPEGRELAHRLIEAGKLEELLRQPDGEREPLTRLLGDVELDEDEAIVDDGGVDERWSERGGGQAARAYVFSRKGDADAGSADDRRRAAGAIGDLVGQAEGFEAELHAVSELPEDGCPVITVLEPAVKTIRHRVWMARNDSDGNAIGTLLQSRDVAKALASGSFVDAGFAAFPSGSVTPAESDLKRAEYNLDRFRLSRAHTFISPGTDLSSEALQGQAKTIAEALGDEFTGDFDATVDEALSAQDWPSDAQAITIVVVIG